MAIPKLEKIVINMGLGEATQNVKIMDPLIADLAAIAGQKPVTTKSAASQSNMTAPVTTPTLQTSSMDDMFFDADFGDNMGTQGGMSTSMDDFDSWFNSEG